MKIISFTVYQLLNGAHINFFFTLLQQARKCAAIVTNLRAELAAIERAYNTEDDILLRLRKNTLTDKIEEKDSLRDRLHSLIYYVAKTSSDLPGEALKQAAQDVLYVVKSYGKLPTMQYDRETGMMRNLCQDLQGPYAEQVATLKLTEVVENMRVANEAFSDLLSERTDEQKGFLKEELAAARKDTDAAYYQFVEVINSLSILAEREQGPAENPYRGFIEWVNADIDRLKREALKQHVHTESAQPTDPNEPGWENPGDGTDPDQPTTPGTGGGEQETPTTYTVTFTHNGQVVHTLQLAEGATINAPAAPSGYQWTNVPATMPAHNVTVSTTAISGGGSTGGGNTTPGGGTPGEDQPF